MAGFAGCKPAVGGYLAVGLVRMAFFISVIVSFIFYLAAMIFGSENYISISILAASTIPFNYIIIKNMNNDSGISTTMISLYFVYAYILPGMLHASKNEFPFYSSSYQYEDILKASVLIIIFSLSFFYGHSKNKEPLNGGASLGDRTVSCMAISSIIVIIAISLSAMAVAGMDNFTQRRLDVDAMGFEGGKVIALGICRNSAIIALASSIHGYKITKNAVYQFFIVLCLAVNAFLNNPITMARFPFFASVIIALAPAIEYRSKNIKIILSFFMIFGFVTIFPFLSHLQRGKLGEDFDINFLQYYFESGDFDGIQSTIDVIKYTDGIGISWGWHFISSLFVFIPRTVWAAKAWPTGVAAAQYMGFEFTNLSSPIPSEFYADFGFLGVIIGGFLTGYFFKFIDYYKKNVKNNSMYYFLITGGISGYCIIFSRGALQGVSGSIISYFGLAYLYVRLLPAKFTVLNFNKLDGGVRG